MTSLGTEFVSTVSVWALVGKGPLTLPLKMLQPYRN